MIKRFLFFAIAFLLMHNESNAQSTITVSMSGPSSICSGNVLTLSASSSDANATLNWIGPNGFSATGASININNITTAASGTYYVTATDTTSTSDPDSISLVVNQTPDVYAPFNQVLCNGGTSSPEGFSGVYTTGTVYNWTNDDATIGLASSGTGDISVFTPTNTSNTPVTANITVTPTANGCTGTAQTFTIAVNPTPGVNSVSSQTLCNTENTSAVSFSGSTVNGTTYSWINTAQSVGLASSGSGDIAAFTASNTTNFPVTALIIVTPLANGCSGPSQSFSITVNPTPVISVPDQAVCNGTNTSDIIFTGNVSGTVYNWTNDNSSIGIGTNGTGNIYSFAATNSTNAPIAGNIAVTPVANGCTGNTSTFVITVNPVPTVNSVSGQTICNGINTAAISFSGSSVAGTAYNWTNSATSIGLAASGINDINSFVATNSGSSATTATLAVTPIANGCSGSSQSFDIVVNPTPNVNSISNQAICNGTSTALVSFTGSVSGSSYNWTNDNASIGLASSGNGDISIFTATNSTSTPATANITVTPSANGCTGTPAGFIFTVNPTLTPGISVSATSGTSICAGTSVTFTASAVNGGSSPVFQWQQNGSAVGTNSSSFTPGSLSTGDVINCVLSSNALCTTSSTATSNSISFVVNPIPTVDPVSNQEICNGTNTAIVTFTGTVSGTTYNWVNTNSSIGLSASGTGNIAAFTAVNASGSNSIAGITVTPTANGCTGTSQSFNITVDPTVTPSVSVVASPGTSVCPGVLVSFTATPVNGGSTPSYQWQKNGNNVGTNNSVYTDNGLNNGDIITCTLTSDASCIATATANSSNTVITIYNQPSISTQPSSSTICRGTNASFSTAATGTGLTYQWYLDAGSGFSSISDGGVYSGTATGTLSITGATSGMNGYHYQCIVSGSCSQTATSNTAVLNVNQEPVISSQPGNITICSGNNPGFTVLATGTGLTYQWMVNTGSSGFTTISDGSLYSGTNSATLSINAATALMNNYQYRCTVSGTCSPAANSNSATLYINTPPAFSGQPSDAAVCAGANTSFTTSVTGTGISAYQWFVNTGSGFVPLSDNSTYSGSATNTLSLTSVTAAMNGYQYQCQAAGTCSPSSTSSNATLTIKAAPAVSANPSNAVICQGANTSFSVSVTGTSPTYQWMVDDGTGFTSLSDAGIYSGTATNTLTLTGAPLSINGYQYKCVVTGACTPSVTTNSAAITVNQLPGITAGPSDLALCENTTANFTVSATGTNPAYQWQVDNGSGFVNLVDGGAYGGTSTNMLEITNVPASMSGLAYRCAVSGTCTPTVISAQAVLTVNTLPSVNSQSSSTTICAGSNTTYSVSATGTSLTYQWQVNTGSGFNNIINSGVYNGATTNTLTIAGATSAMDGYTYRCSVSGTCTPVSSSNPVSLNVHDLPAIVTQPSSSSVCNGANTSYSVSATGSGITYQWQLNSGSGYANIADNSTYSGSTTSTLHVTSASNGMNGNLYQCIISGTCAPAVTTNAASLTFNANPVASISAAGQTTFCGGNSVVLNASTGTNYTYQWQLNGTNLGGTNSSSYSASAGGNYTVVVTNANGCSTTSNSIPVTVNPNPSAPVNVLSGTLVFCSGSSVLLGTNNAGGLTYQWQNNGVNIPGQTSMTYTATAPGNYSVIVTESTCTNTSNSVTVIVNPLPSANLTLNNPAVICSAGGSVLISSVAAAGQTYQWYQNGLPISGANASQYAATSGGWYNVQITNTGCTAYSNSAYVTYSTLTAPVITQMGASLTTSTYTTYQWYYNGSAIQGANTAVYTPTQNGNYSVSITDTNGCTSMSADYLISNVGVSHITMSGNDVKVYPNPASSVVHIDAPSKVNAAIFDLQGKKILQQDDAATININQLVNGVYLIQLYNQDGSLIKTERLVKNNW